MAIGATSFFCWLSEVEQRPYPLVGAVVTLLFGARGIYLAPNMEGDQSREVIVAAIWLGAHALFLIYTGVRKKDPWDRLYFD